MSRSESSSPLPAALKPWLFPLGCAVLYAMAYAYDPGKTILSLRACGRICTQLWLPLCVALTMMILLNRFLSPSLASRFLGREAGARGVLFSMVAGIVSMGPIYAWYPLFATLKEKGASSFCIANFVCCRSVKLALIPVLIGYFGWHLTGLFLLMTLVAALLTAACVGLLCPFGSGEDDLSA